MTTFINIHTLISHASSMMNRDDSGLQKTAVFGGSVRTRITSQCLKRAIRESDIYRNAVDEVSIRTNKVDLLIDECVKAMPEIERSKIESVVLNLGSKIKKGKNKETGETIRKFYAVQPYSIGAIRELVAMVDAGTDLKGIKTIPIIPTFDVCLSGRMDAHCTERKVEAAISVAHSITTHTADIEVDWFTACDDLDKQGSGHIGTNEFSSGVFYRYASINMDLLAQNTGKTIEELKPLVAAVVRCFAQVTPPAKEKTFAAHAMAEFVLTTESSLPLSLANAFRDPVNNTGKVMNESVSRLTEHYESMKNGYDLKEDAAVMDLTSQTQANESLRVVGSIKELVA